MSNFLSELESLTRKQSAVLRLTIDSGLTRVSYKQPGKRALVVADNMSSGSSRQPTWPVDGILQTLLQRLGYAGVPTNEHFVEKMNPAQRQRARELIGALQRLREEVLGAPPPSAYEPRLAPPRSSLHPQIVQGAPDPSPAVLRKRESRRASRRRRCAR